jgi:hypothetical protein
MEYGGALLDAERVAKHDYHEPWGVEASGNQCDRASVRHPCISQQFGV